MENLHHSQKKLFDRKTNSCFQAPAFFAVTHRLVLSDHAHSIAVHTVCWISHILYFPSLTGSQDVSKCPEWFETLDICTASNERRAQPLRTLGPLYEWDFFLQLRIIIEALQTMSLRVESCSSTFLYVPQPSQKIGNNYYYYCNNK